MRLIGTLSRDSQCHSMQASTGSKEKSVNNSGAKISRKFFTDSSYDNLSQRHPDGLNMTQARHLLTLRRGAFTHAGDAL
jgi:hypothetical protein